jgi:hypothetical protein
VNVITTICRVHPWVLAVAAVIAAGCTPITDNGQMVSYADDIVPIKTLAQFEKDNPSCRMWTNWQSLCSRTGPSMNVFCKKDEGFAVEPSEPFCVSQEMPVGQTFGAQFDTASQRQSRNRFCRQLDDDGMSSGLMAPCAEYSLYRPFDGLRSEAVVHPLCMKWKSVGEGSTAPQRCVAWKDDLPCDLIVGNGYLHPFFSEFVAPVPKAAGSSVWGVACIEKDDI